MAEARLGDGTRVVLRPPRIVARLAQPASRVALVPVRGPAGPRGTDSAAELAAHIADHNPHPTYDQMLDLALLYDNGLV